MKLPEIDAFLFFNPVIDDDGPVESNLQEFIDFARSFEREAADLRRQLAEAQDFVTAADEQVHFHGMAKERAEIRAETAEADARELWNQLDGAWRAEHTIMKNACIEKHRAKYGREG